MAGTTRRKTTSRTATLIAVLAVTGCVRAGFDASSAGPTDAPPSVEQPIQDQGQQILDRGRPDGAPHCTWGPFSGAAPVKELNDGYYDWETSLSADGLTIYFSSDRGGGKGANDIWVAERLSPSAPFGTPSPLAIVNTTDTEGNPSVSADGTELYFTRPASVSPGLFVSRRASVGDTFATPVPVEGVTGCADGPDISHDGLTLYYTTCWGSGPPPTIAVATRPAPGQPFAFQRVVTEVGDGGWPSISSDGLELFFESDRSGVLRIYVARRKSTAEPFGAPALVKEIDTARGTEDADISADGRTLYYSFSPNDVAREIWRATRTCVP